MATPSNRFEQVDEPKPDAVTVTIWDDKGQACGHVMGPVDGEPSKPPLIFAGEDGSLEAFKALVIGCHLANTLPSQGRDRRSEKRLEA